MTNPGSAGCFVTSWSLHTTLDVVAEASSSEQALAVTATVKPDVVIMDSELPGMNGNFCHTRV